MLRDTSLYIHMYVYVHLYELKNVFHISDKLLVVEIAGFILWLVDYVKLCILNPF